MVSYRDVDFSTLEGRLKYAGFDEQEREILKECKVDQLSAFFMEQARYNDLDTSLEAHIGRLLLDALQGKINPDALDSDNTTN